MGYNQSDTALLVKYLRFRVNAIDHHLRHLQTTGIIHNQRKTTRVTLLAMSVCLISSHWALTLAVAFAIMTLAGHCTLYTRSTYSEHDTKPISVNNYFSCQCNKECRVCLHSDTTLHATKSGDLEPLFIPIPESASPPTSIQVPEGRDQGLECQEHHEENQSDLSMDGEEGKWVDVEDGDCDSFNDETNITTERGMGDNAK
jgi:hypothetical protein